MNDNEDQSPYGRGFVAASIVVAAVLLCGALLLITGLTSDSSSTSSANPTRTTTNLGDPTDPGNGRPAPGTDPATPGADPATPGSGADSTGPGTGSAGPGAGSDRSARPVAAGWRCSLPAGDQTVPSKPPVADGWDVSRHVVVPRSSTFGPATTDPDGFRRCFAHSPTGAVYAAYNVIAAISDHRQAIPTARKLMVPGPDTDALIRELKSESDSSGSAPTQVAGFRVLDNGTDRVTVMLALPVESAYMSATLTLVWYGDDWRLRPPSPGQPVGAPFAQHRDLADFTRWSGI
ncbi:hypothetical protein [Kribbella sp. CA-247076]|uniref:hypothetical protein n=1 Tax=Kribbella sp. CA-247076 TaxID=3239941 RepID=UPI003D91CD53